MARNDSQDCTQLFWTTIANKYKTLNLWRNSILRKSMKSR